MPEDIEKEAQQLLARYGSDAAHEAGDRAAYAAAKKDKPGELFWTEVRARIEALQPPPH